MIGWVDVHYHDDGTARAACGVAYNWSDAEFEAEYVVVIDAVEPYQPGQFYRREMPCILAVLEKVQEAIHILVIDGFVVLGSTYRPGLGWHLAQATHNIAVIGLAKSPFADTPEELQVFRGGSSKPLFVSTHGISLDIAKNAVESMAGRFRLPSLVKRVDQLSKGIVLPKMSHQ